MRIAAVAALAAGFLALTACNLKSQTIPGFSPRFASADYQVLARTNHEECGTYVFIDWGHLFKDESATVSASASNPLASILASIPFLGGPPESSRALYHALERIPEATHLLEPRIHTSWEGIALAPFLMFGTRCATVEAHGVRIGDRPVPNAQ
ncbi:MAG: hypothetical protein ACJAZO_005219 [Myxococcota bacterium]|jgi:hypothetical protein